MVLIVYERENSEQHKLSDVLASNIEEAFAISVEEAMENSHGGTIETVKGEEIKTVHFYGAGAYRKGKDLAKKKNVIVSLDSFEDTNQIQDVISQEVVFVVNCSFHNRLLTRASGRSGTLIYLGVDKNVFEPAADDKKIGDFFVGYVGEDKYALQALKNLSKNYPGMKILSKEFSLKDEEMINFYKKLDLFVNLDFGSGGPLSLLQAMSVGVPVVSVFAGIGRDLKNKMYVLRPAHKPEDKLKELDKALSFFHVRREGSKIQKERIRMRTLAERFPESKMISEFKNLYNLPIFK